MNDTLLISLLALVGVMTLGIIGGGRKLAFAAFTYQVPYIMLKGQFESYFADISKSKNDYVILFLGSYLMTFCIIEFVKPLVNQKKSPKPKTIVHRNEIKKEAVAKKK